MSEIIEISTWEELLATEVNKEYSWVGGSLDFNEIAPNGFDSTIKIPGGVDFNGATFFNFRSIALIALSYGTVPDNGRYWKNLTFQNIEHMPIGNSYGAFIAPAPNFIENIVITGNIQCPQNLTSRYSLIQKYYGQGYNNRVSRLGTDIVFKGNCSFFLVNESTTSDPSNTTRLPLFDSRIKLDLDYSSTKSPYFYNMYNCKISGKVKNINTSATELTLNPYYCAISLESNKPINCPNLNLVRSDLATYTANSRLVECEAPFYEYKDDIADSGFPYNGAEWDGGD